MKEKLKQGFKSIIYFVFSRFLKLYGEPSSIYLTFDDGPHPENTLKIVNTLDQYGIKATFFMTGAEMLSYKDIVKKLLISGHQVGYHSYEHKSIKDISIGQFIKELKEAKKIGHDFGFNMTLYRPPYGDLTLLSLVALAFYGWTTIMWSKDSMDSFETEDEVLDNVSSQNIDAGEIVLFHDDYSKTANVLTKILDSYKEANIKCGLFINESDFIKLI